MTSQMSTCGHHSGHEARLKHLEASVTEIKEDLSKVQELNENINRKFIQIQTTIIMLLLGSIANILIRWL